MRPLCWTAGLLLAFAVAVASGGLRPPLAAADDRKDDGFVPMFNGKDLTGWVNVNTAPGTFFVKDGEIVTTGKPTGFLRTAKQFENFIAEFDWKHIPPKPDAVGNSGFFVWADPLPAVGSPYTRGIEVQVLVNLEYRDKKTGAVTATSHGDLFSIWGAKCVPDRPHPLGWERCLPSEERAKGAGEWNHYRVEANDGVLKLAVNGKVVSGVSKCSPRKGYLALESEGSECHFRNLKIKELPSTNPKPEEVAKVWEGHRSIFNSLDLKGWKTEKDAWKAQGGKLVSAHRNFTLKTEKKYGPFELIFDSKLPPKPANGGGRIGLNFAQGTFPVWDLTGLTAMNNGDVPWKHEKEDYELKPAVKPNSWARSVVRFDGKTLTVSVNGTVIYQGATEKPRKEGMLELSPAEGLEIMNVFVRELKEKK